MLVIRRTENGGLRMTDGRRTDTAATEEQARRVVMTWGYGNFSFNRALIQMKEAEGTLAPAANPWAARARSAEPATPAPSTSDEGGAVPAKESALPNPLKEPPTMKVPVRARRAQPAPGPETALPTGEAPSPGATEAGPLEPSPHLARARSRPPRKTAAQPAPATATEVPAPVVASAPVTTEAETKAPRRARRRTPGSSDAEETGSQPARAPAPAEAIAAAPAETGAGTVPAKKRVRKPRSEETPIVPVPEPAPVAGTSSAPVKRAPASRKKEKPTSAADGVPASTVAEPAPAPGPSTDAPRSKRVRVPRQPSRTEAVPASTPEAWLETARALFAEGTQALRDIEGATLPFARGPWTELRVKSAEILACLQGKSPAQP